MPRRRKSGLPVYDVPYPLGSLSGRRAVDGLLDQHAQALGEMWRKANTYFDSEIGILADQLGETYNKFLVPTEQALNRLRGQLDVLGSAAIGRLQNELARQQETFDRVATKPLPHDGNGRQTSMVPGLGVWPDKPAVAQPPVFPVARPLPDEIKPLPRPPCPECGIVTCPAPVVNVTCPECHCEAICSIEMNYVLNLTINVVQQILQQFNCSVDVTVQNLILIIQEIVNEIVLQTPPPPPPEPAPQLGRDCTKALHVILCGSRKDQTPLGSDCDHPLFIVQCVPAPPAPVCPVP